MCGKLYLHNDERNVSLMGYSITEEQGLKIEALRAEGRLCQGASASRVGCMTRATVAVTTESWTYKIGEGESHTARPMAMCRRHAYPVGFAGVNFRVLGVEKLARKS